MSGPGPPSSDATSEASAAARRRAIVAMLRQLWLGLSTYRLYPENPDRPGFAAALERIGSAVGEALASGPVDLDIRAERFVLDGEPVPRDDALERLALVCFERRAERLTVTAVPSSAELQHLYAVLSRPAAEVEEAGGVEDALRGAVTSLTLSRIGPGAVEEADHVPPGLATPPPSLGRLDVDVLASELMVEDLRGSPSEQAETLLARLRHVIAEGSVPEGPRINVHIAVHDMLTDLPTELRRSLLEMLVDRAPEDPVAGRLIGTMSNAELSRALVDAGGGGGRNPVELARQLALAGVRQVDIVDLTRALDAGQEDAGTIIAGLEQLGVDVGPEGDAPPAGSVLEVLADYLGATASEDVRSIREAVAAGGDEVRAAQVLAVADYLALETDLERAGETLSIWSDELRRALRSRDEREVVSLLQPVRNALLGGDDDRRALFESFVRLALTPEIVLEAAAAEAVDGRPHLGALLEPFGEDGVEVLLDLLAEEQDRTRRARLLGALRRIVPDHPGPVVARLRDPRWYVVRNAVSLLASGGNPTVLARLAETARHPSAEVRREVAEAIANAGGTAAVPFLVSLAIGGADDVRPHAVTSLGTLVGSEAAAALAEVALGASDRAIRLQALDELAGRREDLPVLHELASGVGDRRLPWRLRRYARRAMSRSERGR